MSPEDAVERRANGRGRERETEREKEGTSELARLRAGSATNKLRWRTSRAEPITNRPTQAIVLALAPRLRAHYFWGALGWPRRLGVGLHWRVAQFWHLLRRISGTRGKFALPSLCVGLWWRAHCLLSQPIRDCERGQVRSFVRSLSVVVAACKCL